MTFQPGANVYTQGFGSRPENVEVPHLDVRAPAVTDILYPVGKRWIDTVANLEYCLTSFSASGNVTTANWILSATAGGILSTLTGDAGGALTPISSNINIVGTAGEISTSGAADTLTIALDGPHAGSTYTAHGVLIGEGASPFVATTAGTNGQLLVGSTGADPAFATLSSSGSTITVTGGAGTLNIDVAAPLNVAHGGTGAITLTGILKGNGTGAVTAQTVTQHDVLVGGASNAITSVAPSATAGVPLVSAGAAADPAFGTAVVAGGGTGAVTLTGVLTGNGTSAVTANAVTQHGVVLGGASNAVSSLGVASTGQTLMGVTGADPAFTSSPSFAGSVTAATTITATLGDITASNGNVVLATAGNKLLIATGANASVGTSSAMAGTPGAVVVATTASSATAKIFYARAVTGGTMGNVSITAQDGTGFTLTSDANETSTFNWWIINA